MIFHSMNNKVQYWILIQKLSNQNLKRKHWRLLSKLIPTISEDGVEVEAKHWGDKELDISTTIPKTVTIKLKEKVRKRSMKNIRYNVLDAINLIIMFLNVIPIYLITKEKGEGLNLAEMTEENWLC